MAFVKLDCGILDSTLWIDKDARDLLITALLMAEPKEIRDPLPAININDLDQSGFKVPAGWYGFVPAAGPGIARRAGLEWKTASEALSRLSSPDDESRTPDFDGRRMVRVDGGFLILNYDKYRQKDHTAKERSARYRARKASRVSDDERDDTPSNDASRVTDRSVTQAYADTYEEREQSPNNSAIQAPVSLESLKSRCGQFGVLPKHAEAWWYAQDARGWTDTHGQPIRRWESSLKKYATSCAGSDESRAKQASYGKPAQPQGREYNGIKVTPGQI